MSETTSNQIYIRTHSSNENFNGDLDIMRISISQAEAKKYVLFVKRATKMAVRFADAGLEIVTHDISPDWYIYHEEIDDIIERAVASEYIVSKYEPLGIHQQRTECDRVHVLSDGIYWSCCPKHSDVVIETATLPLSFIETLTTGEALPESEEEA